MLGWAGIKEGFESMPQELKRLDEKPNPDPNTIYVAFKIKDTKKNIKGRSEEFRVLTQRAQLALYAMGYYSGDIDGLMNNETISSITKYQNKHNLKVTGSLSDELIAYLDIGGDIEKKF